MYFEKLPLLIKNHLKILYELIDPIMVKREDHDEQNIKNHFLIPLVVFAYTIIYGLIGLQYELNDFIDFKMWETDSSIFTHRICPKSIWKFIDFGILIDTVASLSMFLMLYCKKSIKVQLRLFSDDHRIYKNSTGKSNKIINLLFNFYSFSFILEGF